MDKLVCFSFRCLVILLISMNDFSYSQTCFGEYCYTYPGADVRRSFGEARAWCAENNSSTLAAVSDESSHDALVQFLSESNVLSPLYLNAKVDKANESTWYFITGDKLSQGEVENQTTDKDNAYKFYASFSMWSGSFALLDSNPQEQKTYICTFKDVTGLSFLGDTAQNRNGLVYVKYENETLNWFEARNRCYMKGGDLAALSSLSGFQASWLNQSLSYWIGLRWTNWRWKNMDTGSEIIYSRWSTGKPNNSAFKCVCAESTSTWNWTDCDCSTERSFVCVKYVDVSTTMSATPLLSSASSARNVARNSENATDNSKLAIGVGVGVGGGVLIILVVVVIIIIVNTRKRKRDTTDSTQTKTKGKLHKEPRKTKAKQQRTDFDGYADIQSVAQPGARESTSQPVVYATPEFFETT